MLGLGLGLLPSKSELLWPMIAWWKYFSNSWSSQMHYDVVEQEESEEEEDLDITDDENDF